MKSYLVIISPSSNFVEHYQPFLMTQSPKLESLDLTTKCTMNSILYLPIF